ncbi:DNA internalization-related competence protein ComEC/Rec2 [Paenibacillus sp. FJAT-27812]|uniref:DNA internalization-related competence protein ComEC/Rec2 n=1 Tax=Paenibacillus sp. FJAT-27812 TaxID=1684143 RepID=UPI0006A78D73|nr:DNA internalization-related competence protein ComEC/Rec2 [Paenibacillus sp. FJAT-27812]
MNRRPLIWFVIFWVFGSAAAAGLNSRGVLLAAGAAALLALAAVLCRQAPWQLAAACVLAVGLAAGERMWADARNVTELPALLAAAEADGPRAAYAAEAVGTIVSAVEVDGDRAMFRVEAQSVHAEGGAAAREVRERLLVHVRLDAQPQQSIAAAWQRGDNVRLAGELTRPAGASNSGGFDYRRYLSSQRTHWLLKVQGTGAVRAAPGPKWTAAALLGRVDAARDWLGARMDAMYPSSQSGYMKGLVLGIREDLDPEQFQQFSRLGLTHILAISGLHVAVFIYALGGLLRAARISRERILLILMLSVPLYVLLAGASPSVNRAGLMSVLALLAARMGKLKDGMHLLAAAAVMMLAFDPFLLENVSFQLSFIVTLGLIVGVKPVRQALPQWQKGKWLLDLAAVTLVAQLVSFPLTIYYFNQFHALSMLANFVLVPFISFIVMPLGAAALLLGMIWDSGGKLLAYASQYANDWTFALVEQLAAVDSVRSIWATPPLWWVASWLLLLGALFQALNLWSTQSADLRAEAIEAMEATAPIGAASSMRMPQPSYKGVKTSFYSLLILSIFMLFYAYKPDLFNRKAAVSFIDVGQGDAIHIRTASGKQILIDGGGTLSFGKEGEEWRERSDPFEVGKKVLVPLLMKRGVRAVDILVISHLDSDHIRGLQAVLDSIPVRSIWWNGTVKEAEDAQLLLRKALELRIPMYSVHAGQQYKIDEQTEVSILWPIAKKDSVVQQAEEQNESSVVMSVRLYHSTFLFSGDINSVTERSIIRHEQKRSNRAAEQKTITVMKAAHHGSRFSTGKEWLDYWRPFGTVASAGASNSYGHPHPDVLSRLAVAGAVIWRTDKDGEVRFTVTAKGLYNGTMR